MFRNLISVCSALLVFANPAAAEMDVPVPDVMGCLAAIELLEFPYRASMQQHCVVAAAEVCAIVDEEAGPCMPALVGSIRGFYADLMPLLPPTIEEGGFGGISYAPAIKRITDTFENVPRCAGLDGYAFTTCEYINLAAAATDLLFRARLAGVPLP